MTGLADSLIARIVRQRDLVAAMDDHCTSIAARVTSRDQNVSVEVDGYGAMTGLWLGPSAHRLGADALAKLIVETAHAAAGVAAAVTLGAKNVAPQHSYSEGRQMQSQPFANSRDQLDLLCRYAMREWANMAQARWLC